MVFLVNRIKEKITNSESNPILPITEIGFFARRFAPYIYISLLIIGFLMAISFSRLGIHPFSNFITVSEFNSLKYERDSLRTQIRRDFGEEKAQLETLILDTKTDNSRLTFLVPRLRESPLFNIEAVSALEDSLKENQLTKDLYIMHWHTY